MKNKIFLILAVVFVSLTSCTNQDAEFENFDYKSVYFAYQSPVRTITLGDDVFDTSADNAYRCKIMATLGGVYSNDSEVTINFEVANSLTTGLKFKDGGDIVAMPSNYYSLSSDKIVISKGQITGGVDVQLTDAFFADPLAIGKSYVIPLLMKSVTNADTILSGKALVANPNKAIAQDWSVAPKDYILYAVKFVNRWHANYLRRGTDVVTKDNGLATIEKRKKEYVEYDEVVKLSTLSLSKLVFPISNYKTKFGINLNLKVDLTLDANEKINVKEREASYQLNDSTTVYNIAASGTGSFVKKGEKKSWGNQDRDGMYLDYNVNYTIRTTFPKKGLPADIQEVKYVTKDTLVLRDRGVTAEVFEALRK